jgi:hypothetical protein
MCRCDALCRSGTIALEQCEALSGNPQEACKELADQRYESSKAEAERQRGRM